MSTGNQAFLDSLERVRDLPHPGILTSWEPTIEELIYFMDECGYDKVPGLNLFVKLKDWQADGEPRVEANYYVSFSDTDIHPESQRICRVSMTVNDSHTHKILYYVDSIKVTVGVLV